MPNRTSRELRNYASLPPLTLHVVLHVQPHPKRPVEIGGLVVDGVVVRVQPLALLQRDLVQQVPDLDGPSARCTAS